MALLRLGTKLDAT